MHTGHASSSKSVRPSSSSSPSFSFFPLFNVFLVAVEGTFAKGRVYVNKTLPNAGKDQSLKQLSCFLASVLCQWQNLGAPQLDVADKISLGHLGAKLVQLVLCAQIWVIDRTLKQLDRLALWRACRQKNAGARTLDVYVGRKLRPSSSAIFIAFSAFSLFPW